MGLLYLKKVTPLHSLSLLAPFPVPIDRPGNSCHLHCQDQGVHWRLPGWGGGALRPHLGWEEVGDGVD